jgi:Signal transduction histidine kinase
MLVRQCFFRFQYQILFEVFAFTFKIALAYSNFSINIFIAHIFVIVLVIAAHFRSEIYNRRFFDELFTSKETLLKFKDFMAEHLPSALAIIGKNRKKILLVNSSFRAAFNISNEDDTLFRFHEINIEHDSTTIQDINSQKNEKFTLMSWLENYITKHQGISFLKANCSYMKSESTKETYDARVLKLMWDGDEAYAVLLTNISHQEAIISLKLANTNQEKALSIVAHEIRNPINGLLGITQMMEQFSQNKIMLNYISLLKTNINLLLNLLNSILDIEQLRSNKLHMNISPVNIREIIENVKSLYEFQLTSKKIDFIYSIDPNIPRYILTDGSRLNQILINLTANALKFTTKGSISIKVEQDPNTLSKVLFTVKDTGIGISKEDCRKLFQMFGKLQASLSLNPEGAGLGLMISNSLVKALNKDEPGCCIKVESEIGQGSTFYFSIKKNYNENDNTLESPDQSSANLDGESNEEEKFAASPKVTKRVSKWNSGISVRSNIHLLSPEEILLDDADTCSGTLSEKKSSNQRNALVVDDNLFNLIVAREILSGYHFSSYFAQNGLEAIEKVKSLQKEKIKFSIILMDCEMPIMDGFKATTILRNDENWGNRQDTHNRFIWL